jgi:hypothetical protein
MNSSGSSITEEIFNTALSNLEFLSDEDNAAYDDQHQQTVIPTLTNIDVNSPL